jgi:hypothetical protein
MAGEWPECFFKLGNVGASFAPEPRIEKREVLALQVKGQVEKI